MQITPRLLPSDAPQRPLIFSIKVNNLFIAACFYFHPEVCIWDVATLNLVYYLFNVNVIEYIDQINTVLVLVIIKQVKVLDGDLVYSDWLPLNSWHSICLHENRLITFHGVNIT